MPLYRRRYVPGGTYAFSVNLADRRSSLLVDHIDLLRVAYKNAEERRPFETVAICVLPDHLHCIWTLPEGDEDFSIRWRMIKTAFSRALPRENDPTAGRRSGERGIWQRRFWEHMIRNHRDFENHIAYIHGNPLHHGWARALDDWPYSSWHSYKRELRRQWTPPPDGMRVGEPGTPCVRSAHGAFRLRLNAPYAQHQFVGPPRLKSLSIVSLISPSLRRAR
jgi:putative transposase